MKSIILIVPQDLPLRQIARLYEDQPTVYFSSSEELVVESPSGWFSLALDENVLGELAPDEYRSIRQRIQAPAFWQLQFSTARMAEIVISRLPETPTILVDNDHGLVTTVSDIRKRISQGRPWISEPA
jgi:hypothetical protein